MYFVLDWHWSHLSKLYIFTCNIYSSKSWINEPNWIPIEIISFVPIYTILLLNVGIVDSSSHVTSLNGKHWWRLSPLDYRWRYGRLGSAYVIRISQHAFTAMCLCYLSINSFLWFFIYLLYNIINDTKNVKLWKLCIIYVNWKKRK